jgi:hypothetical protein
MKWRGLLVRIAHFSRRRLSRLAAVLALIGLAMMAGSVIFPRPLPVILAMSVGHAIGAAAVICYLLAVLLDIWRVEDPIDSLKPPRVAPRTDEE